MEHTVVTVLMDSARSHALSATRSRLFRSSSFYNGGTAVLIEFVAVCRRQTGEKHPSLTTFMNVNLYELTGGPVV